MGKKQLDIMWGLWYHLIREASLHLEATTYGDE